MKEFSRYAFGDCDEVSTRLQGLTNRLSNMTDVRTPNDFHETVTQFESAMRELHDKTAIVQDLYKEDFQRHERFLSRCRLFAEAINDTERRTLETQISADYWNEQLRQFPEMAGTIRGVSRYYQRKADQIRAEEQRKEQARRRAEEARQRQLQLQEEERRQQARIAEEQRLAALKREEDERERRRRIQEEQERNRRRREEEERRELELQRLKAEEEKARIERESAERRDKTKSFMLKASVFIVTLFLIGAVVYGWHAYQNEQRDLKVAPIHEELSRVDSLDSLRVVRAKVAALRAESLFIGHSSVLDSLDTEITRKKDGIDARKREMIIGQIKEELRKVDLDSLAVLIAVRDKVAALRTDSIFTGFSEVLDLLERSISQKEDELENKKRDLQITSIRNALAAVDTLESLDVVHDRIAALRTNSLFVNHSEMIDQLEDDYSRKDNVLKIVKRDSLLKQIYDEVQNTDKIELLSTLRDKAIVLKTNPLFAEHLGAVDSVVEFIDRKKSMLSAKANEPLLAALRDAIAEDNLNSCRERIADLRRRGLTPYQKSVVDFCDKFCDKLERAQNGDSESMMWVALQHSEQKTVVEQDRKKAVTWYEKAADAGDSNAMMTLAIWSESGLGFAKDEKLAIFWYTKAAKAGVGNAMYRLGVFYAQGKMGLEKSTAKAHEMFLNAQKNGCTYTDEKTGVDAWLKATKPQDATSRQRSHLGDSNTGGEDLDSLLNDLEASSSGR